MYCGGKVLRDMEGLIRLLAPHCEDRTTIDALSSMLSDERSWTKAHDLFDKICRKTLVAERGGNSRLTSQYLFEESCAKTLFNLSDTDAPFDPDAPYWIIPNALSFGRCVGVPDAQVIKVIAA